jgi:hypothetical protein
MISADDFLRWDPADIAPGAGRNTWAKSGKYDFEWLGGHYEFCGGDTAAEGGVSVYLGKVTGEQDCVIVNLKNTFDVYNDAHDTWDPYYNEAAEATAQNACKALGLPTLFSMNLKECEAAVNQIASSSDFAKFTTPVGYSFILLTPDGLILDIGLAHLAPWSEDRVFSIAVYHSASIRKNCVNQDPEEAIAILTTPDDLFESFERI